MMVTSSLISNNLGLQSSQKVNNNNKNCSKQSSFGSSGLAGTVAAIAAVSSMPGPKIPITDNSKLSYVEEKEKEMNGQSEKQKQLNESLQTSVCTPVSTDSTSDSSATQQCEETWPVDSSRYDKVYQPLLATPSLERLLPIGVLKSPGLIQFHINNLNKLYQIIF